MMRILAIGAMAATVGTVFAKEPIQADYEPGKLLVKMKPGFEGEALSVAKSLGATVTKVIPKLNVAVVRFPASQTTTMANRFSSHPKVKYADLNYYYKATIVPNDPDYTKQWGNPMVNAPAAWDISTGKASTIVAVLDTGVDLDHPEFAGRMLPGYDFADNDSDPDDTDGHGTHCAGSVAARGNNGIGVAGMNWNARILPVRVLGPGGGSLEGVAQGMIYAADQGAKVLSMSLGGYGTAQVMGDAVDYVHAKGALIIAAAGNDNTDQAHYPSDYPLVVSVGATNESDAKAGFSNYGPAVDVAAPGENIYSTFPGSYGYSSGTSMACPMVSGLAALVFGQAPAGTTNLQVRKYIEDNCLPMDTSFVQKGRIQAAVTMAKIPKPVSTIVQVASISKHSGGSTSGNVLSVRKEDGAFYTIASANHATLGAVSGAYMNFTLPSTVNVSTVASATLHIKQRGALRVTNMLYAWNYTTGRFDLIRSFPMSSVNVKQTVELPSTAYISSTRQMRFLTRALLPKRLQTPASSTFVHAVDYAGIALSVTN